MVLTQYCKSIWTVIAQSGNLELILSRRLDEAVGLGEAELMCELLSVQVSGRLCLELLIGILLRRQSCVHGSLGAVGTGMVNWAGRRAGGYVQCSAHCSLGKESSITCQNIHH